jgi:hypothetical protein
MDKPSNITHFTESYIIIKVERQPIVPNKYNTIRFLRSKNKCPSLLKFRLGSAGSIPVGGHTDALFVSYGMLLAFRGQD